ncbi:hypothetical protein CBL_11132 [Carabus blaptoides fortunei]
MGCCARKASAWTTAIMVYTIVQSVCSAIWQIYQILLYENVVPLPSNSNALLNAIYAVYYIQEDFLGFQLDIESGRVHILAIAHLTVDIFWIFISIIALSVKSKKNSAYGVNIFWMCTAVIELVIDVTSVALFTNNAITWLQDSRPPEFIAGAILMAIISSRFILPLLLNVCMFFGMISITKALKKPPIRGAQHQQYQHQQVARAPRHSQHRIVPLKPAMRTPRPPHLQEQNLSRVNNWYNHYDEPINVPRNPNDDRFRENSQGPSDIHQRRYEMLPAQNLPKNPTNLRGPMSPGNLQVRRQNSPMNPENLQVRGQNSPISPGNPPYRSQNAAEANTTEVLRQDQDPSSWYNVYDDWQSTQLPRVKSDGRPHRLEEDADLDVEDDAPSELSYNDHQNFVGDHTNVMVNGVPSGTLRRQLPWSYVHQPGMFPRKQTHDLSIDAPPVPVPDYTMRYNRNQRVDLDAWTLMNNSDNSCVCFTCKDAKMTLLKGKRSLLRYLGFIAAIFAVLQALIWIGMCISGITCFYIKCGIRQPANRFGKTFYKIYLSTKHSRHYPHFITPIFFHIMLWFFMILSVVWLFASVSLIVDYRKWAVAKRLRKSSKRWIVVTIIVCLLDLLLFVLFVVDFHMLKTGNIGASVRSMNEEEYEDSENNPYKPHDTFDEYYDSENNTVDNSTVLSTTVLSHVSEVTSVETSTPALTFEERLERIKGNLARKSADLDKRIKDLLAQAKLIRETELGIHYNPYARARAAKLIEQLDVLEKLYGMTGKSEDELNQHRMLEEKRKLQEQRATTTEKATTQTEATYPADDSYQNDDHDDVEEEPDSSANARRNFDRLWPKMKASGNDIDKFAETQANLGDTLDDYNDMWRSTFQDEDYGIILQNDGPGTSWRKISTISQGSASGTDVMLAPSAVLMTLAIRGYVLWITNLASALMLLYLYITRPRRPSLITRVQA